MADIVERLRDMHCDVPESYVGKLRIEASDEIEMLWNAVAEKNAEIERLHALLRELIDIEGPQPGTADWAAKVRAALEVKP